MNAAPREQEWGVGNLTKTLLQGTAHSLDKDAATCRPARQRRGGAAEQLEVEDGGGEGARLGHAGGGADDESLTLLVTQVGRLERLAAQGVAEPAGGGAAAALEQCAQGVGDAREELGRRVGCDGGDERGDEGGRERREGGGRELGLVGGGGDA